MMHGYRSGERMRRTSEESPGVQPAARSIQIYPVLTNPPANILCFPPHIKAITQISVIIEGYVRVLQPLPSGTNAVTARGTTGKPAWYQVYDTVSGLQVHIWPIPDDVYSLDVYAIVAGLEDPGRKAWQLLTSWLTPAQRMMLEKDKSFEVVGSETGRVYRISHGNVFNVHELDDTTGQPVRNLCFTPDYAPYVGDVMLAQKILLETDEARALRIANTQAARGTFPA